MGSGVCGQAGRGRRCTEEKNRPAWMGLACRWKGEQRHGEGEGGVRAGRFWEKGQDGQYGPKKTFQDTQGIDVAPRGEVTTLEPGGEMKGQDLGIWVPAGTSVERKNRHGAVVAHAAALQDLAWCAHGVRRHNISCQNAPRWVARGPHRHRVGRRQAHLHAGLAGWLAGQTQQGHPPPFSVPWRTWKALGQVAI